MYIVTIPFSITVITSDYTSLTWSQDPYFS